MRVFYENFLKPLVNGIAFVDAGNERLSACPPRAGAILVRSPV